MSLSAVAPVLIAVSVVCCAGTVLGAAVGGQKLKRHYQNLKMNRCEHAQLHEEVPVVARNNTRQQSCTFNIFRMTSDSDNNDNSVNVYDCQGNCIYTLEKQRCCVPRLKSSTWKLINGHNRKVAGTIRVHKKFAHSWIQL